MQPTPRKCPHCFQHFPHDRGFVFDSFLNMLCSRCGKVIFPATAEAESTIPKRSPGYLVDVLGPIREENETEE